MMNLVTYARECPKASTRTVDAEQRPAVVDDAPPHGPATRWQIYSSDYDTHAAYYGGENKRVNHTRAKTCGFRWP